MMDQDILRAAPPKATAQRTPVVIAIERIARLSGQGVAPHRSAGATMDILADWRSRQVPAEEMLARLETLRRDIEGGVQAAEAYVAEAESEAAKVAAAMQLEGLVTVAKVLARELERC